MSVPREELGIDFNKDGDSIFIFYLTGTLALVFVVSLVITQSLQRKQPVVTELVHDSNITGQLVTYLVIVETSIWPGSGCPSGVKVYMQLTGLLGTSQYFLLQSIGSNKLMLKRGFTDIFLIKLPVSLGPILSVRFILSGLNGPLKCSRRSMMEKLLVYHQWVAQFGNTLRYGAFTAVIHVICVFTTLTVLLDFTLITYIFLPSGTYKGEFELVQGSVLIGTFCSAVGCCLVLFMVEMILRNIRSHVGSPGNAYFTLYDENKNLNAVCAKITNTETTNEETFLMRSTDFDAPMKWDPAFQSMTNFLTRFLCVLNSESCPVFFHKGENDDTFLSACDLSTRLSIPKYSGIALNHLLHETLHEKKGSSLYNLIHSDTSFTITKSDSIIISDDGASGDIIVEFEGGHPGAIERKASQKVHECNVNSDLFWRQYKNRLQDSKHKQSFYDNNEEFGKIISNDAESDSEEVEVVTKFNFEPEKHQKKGVSGAAFEVLLEKKSSLNIGGSVSDVKVNKAYEFVVDLTGEVEKLNLTEVPIAAESSVNIDEDDGEESSLEVSEESLHIADVSWESILKLRSRKLVADICNFYRKIRIEVIEGNKVHILPMVTGWIEDVVGLVSMSCSVKTEDEHTEFTRKIEFANLAVYASGEIIRLTIDHIYKALKAGTVDLPDIIVQSHHIMLAVEEAAFSILFANQKSCMDLDQLRKLRSFDVQKYTSTICTEFLQHSFQLIVSANELTWAYFEIYLLQTLRKNISSEIFNNMIAFVEENLQHESEETVIIRKLCKTASEEAKGEIWSEYHTETDIFLDMMIKQEILDKLDFLRSKIIKRKENFDEEYKLLAAAPKSRLQILAEKRKKKKPPAEIKKPAEKWILWHFETGKMDIPSYKDLIEHSLHLKRDFVNLSEIQERLGKRWRRLGLKHGVNGVCCLVQSLVYGNHDGDDAIQAARFKDYLQVKRIENLIKDFLRMTLEELTQFILQSATEEYNLLGYPTTLQVKLATEDICIRVDTMKDFLLEELETITEYAVTSEQHHVEMDRDIVNSTTHLIMRKSSNLIQWAPCVTNQFMSACERISQKSVSLGSQQDEVKVSQADKGSSQPVEHKDDMAVDKAATNVTVGLEDMKTELKLLKLFLKDFCRVEGFRKQCTVSGYFERHKEKRSRIANIVLHNIIDSYYIIEEGDDSKTFTKAGFYQIEHDVMGEAKKKLPSHLKNLMAGLLVVFIITSLVLVMLIGHQFDTTQNQEYICYYLISVLEFAFLFEPIRALVVASLCRS